MSLYKKILLTAAIILSFSSLSLKANCTCKDLWICKTAACETFFLESALACAFSSTAREDAVCACKIGAMSNCNWNSLELQRCEDVNLQRPLCKAIGLNKMQVKQFLSKQPQNKQLRKNK